MRLCIPIALALGALLTAAQIGAARAEDMSAGRKKAVQCQACHGLDGKAKVPDAPNLAGQNEQYLAKALGDYKSGARQNDMMSLIAPKLSDQDIADLAAYYAGLPAVSGG
ncbi:MAG TPA: cytochrome c [Aliidongia sp.]|nr:cytochrome c [Aliidongia sp.]